MQIHRITETLRLEKSIYDTVPPGKLLFNLEVMGISARIVRS